MTRRPAEMASHAICEFNHCPEDTTCASCVYGQKNNRLADIEDILGDNYDLDHLKQLIEADREGRCVVLPCKVGDTVFVVGKKKIVKARVQEIYLDDIPELIYLVDFECDNCCDGCPFNSWSQSWEGERQCDGEYGDGSIKDSNFGKTVFRTRESAESALKAMKERKTMTGLDVANIITFVIAVGLLVVLVVWHYK